MRIITLIAAISFTGSIVTLAIFLPPTSIDAERGQVFVQGLLGFASLYLFYKFLYWSDRKS